jgi:hypothetical protein
MMTKRKSSLAADALRTMGYQRSIKMDKKRALEKSRKINRNLEGTEPPIDQRSKPLTPKELKGPPVRIKRRTMPRPRPKGGSKANFNKIYGGK